MDKLEPIVNRKSFTGRALFINVGEISRQARIFHRVSAARASQTGVACILPTAATRSRLAVFWAQCIGDAMHCVSTKLRFAVVTL